MNNYLNEEDIATFNWSELHNRVVRVIVVEDSGVEILGLYDTETQEVFMVNVKIIKDVE